MPPKFLPPLAPQLDHLKSKADIIPEIFFCGQIVGATDIDCEDALLCEMTLETGQYWELIYPGKEKTYQTQTAYAEVRTCLSIERVDVRMVSPLRLPLQGQ